MSALKNHGPKIGVGVVVIACGVFAYMEHSAASSRPADFDSLEDSQRKIKEAATSTKVPADFHYSADAKAKLKFKESLEASLERANKRPEGEVASYVAYPMPSRPVVDDAGRPIDPNQITQPDYAETDNISDVKAEGDHGRVYVTFKIPQKMKYMAPVRVEVYRGMAADKIDLKNAYATVELGPEDNASAAATAEEPAATAEKPSETKEEPAESAGARRRAARTEDKPTTTPKRDVKKEEKKEEIPAEYADVRVFCDTHVDPKKTYFYQVRLLSKMTVPTGKRIEQKDGTGAITKIIVINAPKTMPTTPGVTPNVTLYTGSNSATVSATPPSNFEIRLAGTSGKIDSADVPEFKRSKEYKGTFAVRVWVTDAQEWHNKTIEAGPGEKLKGTIMYKTGKDTKSYDFDAGYRLVEIKSVLFTPEVVEKVQVLDDSGNPVVDPKTGKPITKEQKKQGQPIPKEVAVLEDLTTGKMEDFEKRGDFGLRKESLKYYERINEEQEANQKVYKKKMDELKQKLKASDDARKAAAEAAKQQDAQQQPATPAGGGFGLPGGTSGGKGK